MSVALPSALEIVPLSAEAFEARFTDLLELICDAAQAGRVEPFMEAQYTVLRAWMRDQFPGVHPHLPEDASSDFEPLFHPQTLSELIHSDRGELMGYLLRTQHAIGAWKSAQ